MLKTFKKSIALFVALVFMLSLVPFSAMAEVEVENNLIKISRGELCNTKGSTTTSYYSTTGIRLCNAPNYRWDHTNSYHGYVKFDLSNYLKEIMVADSAGLSIKGNSSRDGNTFQLSILDGIYEDWSAATLNSQVAHDKGMDTAIGVYTGVHQYTGSSSVAHVVTDDNMLPAIKQVLADDPDDSVIVFRFSGQGVNFEIKNIGLELVLDCSSEKVPSDIEYLEFVKEKLQWNFISDNKIDNVISNINLPKKFYGTDVLWESTNEDVINPSSGEIDASGYSSVPVTLTANISYTSAPGTRVTDTKTFDVVVRDPDAIVSKTIPLSNGAHTRSNTDNINTIYGCDTSTASGNTYTYFRFGGVWKGGAQIDFTGYEEILKNPGTTAKISFASPWMGASGHGAYDYNVYMISDSNDSYVGDELNYIIATNTYDLYNTEDRPVLYTKTPANVSSDGLERGDFGGEVNINNIVNVLEEGTDNSVISLCFKNIYNTSNSTYIAVSAIDASNGNPIKINTGLTITYDKTEIDNEAYLTEVKNALIWDVLSEGDQDKVSADLYLPTKFKGANIIWESDNEAVLSDGTVDFANNKGETVKLTAKMTYTNILGDSVTAEKEFELQLSDGEYYEVATPSLTLNNNKFEATWSVENYTGTDVTYYVYLAVYSNQELVALTPVTYVAKNGKLTSIAPVANYAEGYTAKLIVLKDDNITPAFTAQER